MRTSTGEYNYAAYLLADENGGFTPSFLTVTFPFEEGFTVPSDGTVNGTLNGTVNDSEFTAQLLKTLRDNPCITIGGLTDALGRGRTTVTREIEQLKDAGRLRREGSDKTGKWVMVK